MNDNDHDERVSEREMEMAGWFCLCAYGNTLVIAQRPNAIAIFPIFHLCLTDHNHIS